jgi:transcriptional regulator with XRE-family HTH domain/anti-sigma regulatory factor (Ser/Thr protein kinase)
VSAEVVSLADRLRRRRNELGISQSQAARELDVARTAYRLWEMEAAKPSPDRWRLIAHWLGVSVTTLLLGEELISADEAAVSDTVTSYFERSGASWDGAAAAKPGTFFVQARTVLEEGLADGSISPGPGKELAALFDRIERQSVGDDAGSWQPTEMRRSLPANAGAPRAARDAVDFAASGVPLSTLHAARLLTSELVTNSVQHGTSGPGDRVGLSVRVGRQRLRVEVSDHSQNGARPAAPTAGGGFGLTLVAALASRWGAGHERELNVTWFELDLPAPGIGAG